MTFTADQVDVVVKTGSDDLRGDSSVSFSLFAPDGDQISLFMLKDRNDPGYLGESTNERTFILPRRLALTDLVRVELKLLQGGNVFESDDNWNIDTITIRLTDTSIGESHVWTEDNAATPPLVRLTGSQPTFALFPHHP